MSMKEVRNAESSLPTILAVDFDGTLVKDKYPLIGEINQPIWDAIIKAHKMGVKLSFGHLEMGINFKKQLNFVLAEGFILMQ